jgi:hypothetical protein
MATPFAFRDTEPRSALVPRDTTGLSDDLEVFARLEGLVREEIALLAIPAHQLAAQQRERLRAVTEELDRIWGRLRERAQRSDARTES